MPQGSEKRRAKWRENQARRRRANPEGIREIARTYRANNRAKANARSLIGKRIERGVLVRPGRCSRCRERCKPQAHHPDYRKPDRVRWLCRDCHWTVEYHSKRSPVAPVGRGASLFPMTS